MGFVYEGSEGYQEIWVKKGWRRKRLDEVNGKDIDYLIFAFNTLQAPACCHRCTIRQRPRLQNSGDLKSNFSRISSPEISQIVIQSPRYVENDPPLVLHSQQVKSEFPEHIQTQPPPLPNIHVPPFNQPAANP